MKEVNEYYLQNGYVGNSILWWAQGRSGYTADITKAHVFTKEEAFAQHKTRKADVPWPKEYIDARIKSHVDAQYCSKREVEELYKTPNL